MKTLFLFVLLCACTPLSIAQTKSVAAANEAAPIIPTPTQQKEFKPVFEAYQKAQKAYNAEADPILAEYKTRLEALKNEYEAKLKPLKTKEALEKATADVLDKEFALMAELKLSAREYLPSLDEKTGELTFQKIKKPQ